jgi:hypothetical protein
VDDLPEARDEVEAALDPPTNLLDPEAPADVEERLTLEDRQGSDFLRPDLAGAQHELIPG